MRSWFERTLCRYFLCPSEVVGVRLFPTFRPRISGMRSVRWQIRCRSRRQVMQLLLSVYPASVNQYQSNSHLSGGENEWVGRWSNQYGAARVKFPWRCASVQKRKSNGWKFFVDGERAISGSAGCRISRFPYKTSRMAGCQVSDSSQLSCR